MILDELTASRCQAGRRALVLANCNSLGFFFGWGGQYKSRHSDKPLPCCDLRAKAPYESQSGGSHDLRNRRHRVGPTKNGLLKTRFRLARWANSVGISITPARTHLSRPQTAKKSNGVDVQQKGTKGQKLLLAAKESVDPLSCEVKP